MRELWQVGVYCGRILASFFVVALVGTDGADDVRVDGSGGYLQSVRWRTCRPHRPESAAVDGAILIRSWDRDTGNSHGSPLDNSLDGSGLRVPRRYCTQCADDQFQCNVAELGP